MQKLIKPQTLKGFRDYLPASMLARERLIETARGIYRSYGFCPIDTPALEYTEILLGKGGAETDKQMFRFTDQGERDVSMRFDLTIPLARFAAQHLAEIGTPFRRYHIATVWRAEKPQKGRYREFMQCDFDTIGTKSISADIEVVLVIDQLLRSIGVERFTMRINHRQVLNGLLEQLGIQNNATSILRSLDKLGKIERDQVIAEIVTNEAATAEQAARILDLVNVQGSAQDVLSQLREQAGGHDRTLAGVEQLRQIVEAAEAGGVAPERIAIDPSIARGLEYYTGTVYETFLDDLPGIGSVCSGGRYDNLAGLYTKQELPGVGASLGLDRLLAALEELGQVPDTRTPAQVLVTLFDGERLNDYLRIASNLRAVGLNVEVFPDTKKLGQQLKYADRQGFRYAVIAGSNEFEARQIQLKDLKSGEVRNIPLDDSCTALATAIQSGMAATST